jgi:tetratricopeptide (TPR) repeat protein
MADDNVQAQIVELIQLADGLFESGKIDEAHGVLLSLSQIVPEDHAVLRLLGIVEATKGHYAEAQARLMALRPMAGRDALVCNVLSVCCYERGEYPDALAFADRALILRPTFQEAFNNRANALNRLGRPQEALAACRQALRLQPGDPIVRLNQANALRELGRQAEALEALDQVIATRPDIAIAHGNRGNVLSDLGRHAEALASYERAIAIDPQMPDAHHQMGNVLIDLCRYEEAIQRFDAALALDPGLARVHLNRSHLNLLLGRYEQGWREYEWRWRGSEAAKPHRYADIPLWLGQESLEGRSIVLHCEQGLGDCLQFVRYARDVAARGATVHLEAYEPLAALFRSIECVEVLLRGDPAPAADFHCPLLSLPLALGRAEPLAVPEPYLGVEPDLVEEWRRQLPGALRVGLVASGNADHKNDHNRSIPLEQLMEALPDGPRYFLLQKDVRDADRPALESRADITDLGKVVRDFRDTAAICMAMDLVITVDTSVAHLAGALARPTWLLLPFDPDWRWRLETERTPWYPSMRLVRQPAKNDWGSALARIRRQLEPDTTVADRPHISLGGVV